MAYTIEKLETVSLDLKTLLEENVFVLETGTVSATTKIRVAQNIEIKISDSSESKIILEKDLEISRIDGEEFDANQLTSSEADAGTLSGLISGSVVEGALQWGIPNTSLKFSKPITISIFVGADLNGETLNIVRSVSGNDSWTSDGIVSPAACVVSEGICTFQATKASYYAAYSTEEIEEVEEVKEDENPNSIAGKYYPPILPANILAALPTPNQTEQSSDGSGQAPTPEPTDVQPQNINQEPDPEVIKVATTNPEQLGLSGDSWVGTVSANNYNNDPDVYAVNSFGYKRLLLNPTIFGFYGHLGGFELVSGVVANVRDVLVTSGYVRNCEANDYKVYALEVTGEDTGLLHWVDMTPEQAIDEDPEFFKRVFCIDSLELEWFSIGEDYNSLNQVQIYSRSEIARIKS